MFQCCLQLINILFCHTMMEKTIQICNGYKDSEYLIFLINNFSAIQRGEKSIREIKTKALTLLMLFL